MVEPTMELLDWFRNQVELADGDVLAEMLRVFAETLMDTDAQSLCNAGFNEKNPERTNTRNGYRSRAWDTRAGTIDLAVPKLRQGSYFPSWLLEPRRRAERALIAVVADCYLAGVSTRRVDKLVKTLGIEGISKSQVSKMAKSLDEMVESFRNRPLDAGPYPYLWLDALVQKSREGGRIVNVARPQDRPLAVSVVVEAEQRVVASGTEVAIVGAALLVSVDGRLRTVDIENYLLRQRERHGFGDPCAVESSERVDVLILCEYLSLETGHRLRAGCVSFKGLLADDRSHGRVPGERLLVVDVLVAGEPRIDRLLEEAGKLVLHVPACPRFTDEVARHIGETHDVI